MTTLRMRTEVARSFPTRGMVETSGGFQFGWERRKFTESIVKAAIKLKVRFEFEFEFRNVLRFALNNACLPK